MTVLKSYACNICHKSDLRILGLAYDTKQVNIKHNEKVGFKFVKPEDAEDFTAFGDDPFHLCRICFSFFKKMTEGDFIEGDS